MHAGAKKNRTAVTVITPPPKKTDSTNLIIFETYQLLDENSFFQIVGTSKHHPKKCEPAISFFILAWNLRLTFNISLNLALCDLSLEAFLDLDICPG